MATLTQLSTSNLALKGAGDEYNYINRFFATKAEADAALADSSWSPVAGKLNACLTGDQGLLVYNESTTSLDLADAATRAYIDAQIGALVGDAPEVLDTLGEISDALNDNPNYFTDAAAATAANTALINAESGRAVAAEAAVQAAVDANEVDIESKMSSVNTALGLSVGDDSFVFNEDMIIVELADGRATDHAGIYNDITTAGPDSATELDIKTALERFAKNSRIVLAAEKHRLDLEDARMDGLVGVSGNDLGTFTKDIISDNTDVKSALQEVETSLASLQGASKVHNYKWSNNNDATITSQHITTDAANWADATKVYIHRQARHSIDMQNAFNNMLLVGAKLYIQRTDIGDKFFTAIINSAATITGTGTDQVFAYNVTSVETIGQV